MFANYWARRHAATGSRSSAADDAHGACIATPLDKDELEANACHREQGLIRRKDACFHCRASRSTGGSWRFRPIYLEGHCGKYPILAADNLINARGRLIFELDDDPATTSRMHHDSDKTAFATHDGSDEFSSCHSLDESAGHAPIVS